MKTNNVYRNIGIVLCIIGGMTGIILGGYYAKDETEFNLYLALISWISFFMLSFPFFALHSICYRLDLIIEKSTNE